MSILVVHLVPQGLLFGADRNITEQQTLTDGSTRTIVASQLQRPKVLKWPNRDVIVGYVGAGLIEERPTDEWLYAFIGRNLEPSSLETVASELTIELDALFKAGDFNQPLIIHLGGFEPVGDDLLPRIFFIRNTVELLPAGAYVVGEQFDCSEEIAAQYFPGQPESAIRAHLSKQVFSFRQGYDLGAFNALDGGLREAIRAIVHTHPGKPIPVPATLDDWDRHVAFAVHAYGAYFAAFYPAFEQYVGGGADVVHAAWSPP